MAEGRITRQQVRELVGEMYIKYGSYTAIGGRLKDLLLISTEKYTSSSVQKYTILIK
jgi:hypothetical protein